ncbi:MAG: LysR family transcriptional regulator [Pseudonocardia sp.]|nr:LysR family transcriptional regulator [Pseudonocardia sp.]
MSSQTRTLDVVPLRSFVAVAECGGFHRAAAALHVSQPTVSDHVKRLESACGTALLHRAGRASRLTPAGETLLVEARRMLSIHDDVLARLAAPTARELSVGSTEHAADQLLPRLSSALGGSVRYRLDRGTGLREALDRGDLDLALLFTPPANERSATAGLLEVRWYAAPGWEPPAGPVPLVGLDAPCALRDRAVSTLTGAGSAVTVACEAAYLAGVLAAARAGLGVALLATMGHTPEGLVERADLPAAAPLPVAVHSRRGLPPETLASTTSAVAGVLGSARRAA